MILLLFVVGHLLLNHELSHWSLLIINLSTYYLRHSNLTWWFISCISSVSFQNWWFMVNRSYFLVLLNSNDIIPYIICVYINIMVSVIFGKYDLYTYTAGNTGVCYLRYMKQHIFLWNNSLPYCSVRSFLNSFFCGDEGGILCQEKLSF